MKYNVFNVVNEKGNTVKNQFNIVDGTNNIFVSYETQIAVLHNASAFIEIVDNPFEYSRTTSRHFLNWLENVLTNSKPTRKDVEQWIKNGSIPATANYLNTDIEILIIVREEDF